jgi:hypothetical protein
MSIRVTQPMLIIGAVVCSLAVVFLSFGAIFCWKYPSFRDEGFPLVLFFDFVFAYRLYLFLKRIKMSRRGQKYGITTLS